MSTVKTDTLLAQSGNPADPVSIPGLERQFAKAWVRFNQTNNTIFSSFNVSSLTDDGTGQTLVNFETAFPTTNIATAASCGSGAGGFNRLVNAWVVSSAQIQAIGSAGGSGGGSPTKLDVERIDLTFFHE